MSKTTNRVLTEGQIAFIPTSVTWNIPNDGISYVLNVPIENYSDELNFEVNSPDIAISIQGFDNRGVQLLVTVSPAAALGQYDLKVVSPGLFTNEQLQGFLSGNATNRITVSASPFAVSGDDTTDLYLSLYTAVLNLVGAEAAIIVLQGQMTTVGVQITGLQGAVTVLNGQMTTANSNITTLQGQVTTIQGQITTLQGQVTTINASITTIQGQITALQTATTTNSTNITTLQGQMTTANTNISTLQGQITTINSSISTLTTNVTTLQTQMTAANAAIAVLQGQILFDERSDSAAEPETNTTSAVYQIKLNMPKTGVVIGKRYKFSFFYETNCTSTTQSVFTRLVAISPTLVTTVLSENIVESKDATDWFVGTGWGYLTATEAGTYNINIEWHATGGQIARIRRARIEILRVKS